jgi:hypothetical protein
MAEDRIDCYKNLNLDQPHEVKDNIQEVLCRCALPGTPFQVKNLKSIALYFQHPIIYKFLQLFKSITKSLERTIKQM